MGRMLKRLPGGQHDEGRTGDQVVRFQNAVDARLREEMALPIRKLPGELARCPLGGDQRQIHDTLANGRRNAIPVAACRGRAWLEPVHPRGLVAPVPAGERGARDLDLSERAPHRQIRVLNQPNRFALLAGGHSYASSSESAAVTLFLSSRFSSTVSATSCFRRAFSFRSSVTSVDVASRVVSPTSRFLPASRNSLLQR